MEDRNGSIAARLKKALLLYIYTDSQKHESTLLHMYVLNEFSTADHLCTVQQNIRGFCLTVYKLCFVLRELVIVTRSKY